VEDKKLTTAFGQPVPDNNNSLTAGSAGPVLLQDYFLLEKLAHFSRERIPERVVHAKGAGAYGVFKVTGDVSSYTKAAFLGAVGKETPVFVRFSTVVGERGSADNVREPRGFAVKFYTEEGNYDLVGLSMPVFFIRDAIKFPDLVHSQKRDPQTNCMNATAAWDFLSLSPESTHLVTMAFTDRGTPSSYRHMDGFGCHTFKFVNAQGEAFWGKIHLKTKSGIKTLKAAENTKLAGEDPDYLTCELFNHLASGQTASWRLCLQVMPVDDIEDQDFDIFDVTKTWSQKEYPLIEVGELTLNRNPSNYFAEVEQSAFSPSNFVPGIEASPDKLLQGRLFAYPDAQRYRLGANYSQIPVNCPYAARAMNYQRDGAMTVNGNGGSAPNYEPNSFHGPRENSSVRESAFEVDGVARRHPGALEDDDYLQAGGLWNILKPEDKDSLVANLKDALHGVPLEIQRRQVGHFQKADSEFGRRVALALGLKLPVKV
jgi:catalase